MLGALSFKENHLYFQITKEKESICNKSIEDFFRALNKKRSIKNCVIVLDRHPAHRTGTEKVLEELKAVPLKLPVNTSIFNSVEYCWGWMKQKLRN